MEKILGVPKSSEQQYHTRYDVREADSLEEEERRDSARQRYQQLYWESVPEDGRVSFHHRCRCHQPTNLALGTTRACISCESQGNRETICTGC